MDFSLDRQRAIACVAGLVGLTASLVLSSLGREPSEFLIGTFATMVMGPILEGTISKYRAAKAEVEGE